MISTRKLCRSFLTSRKALSLLFLLHAITHGYSQNNAVDLDGSNDYVAIGNSIYSSGVQTFTIECWIKPGSLATGTNGNYYAIYGYQLSGSSLAIKRNPSLYLKGGEIHTDLNDGSARYDYLTSNLKLLQDKWVHIAWVKSGTSQSVYVNGNLLYTRTAPSSVSIYGNYNIGQVDNNFDGSIDEVRFWSVARSQEDLLKYMNRSLSGSETGLEAYYTFDEGTGTTTENKATKNTSST